MVVLGHHRGCRARHRRHGGNNNSQSGSSTATSSSAQNVAPKSTPKKNAKLTGITAAYNGSIKDGEQVTDQTSGITVTAKYDDGTTKNVTGWKIQNPGAVNINAPTEFTVEYEGQTAKVSIRPNRRSNTRTRSTRRNRIPT